MNLIELHILQSFPVSCLNRDDLGSPKSAIFGGVKRARISSQCLKRAHRMQFRDMAPNFARGERTKLITTAIANRLKQESIPGCDEHAKTLAEMWGKLDTKKKDAEGLPKSTTLTYLSPGEIDSMVSAALTVLRENPQAKKADLEKAVKASMKKSLRKDAADIALFGRMVASDPSLNIEGAALFSHALSCHKAEPEIDFYTAIDDLQPEEVSGAGMAGILEFNSACYYRYIGINVDLLRQNLPGISSEEENTIITAFIRSALIATPTARKNSMNAATLPSYVLGVRRQGHPLQLANAFECPVKSSGTGYVQSAREALEAELQHMKQVWGYEAEQQVVIPDVNVFEFISALTGSAQ